MPWAQWAIDWVERIAPRLAQGDHSAGDYVGLWLPYFLRGRGNSYLTDLSPGLPTSKPLSLPSSCSPGLPVKASSLPIQSPDDGDDDDFYFTLELAVIGYAAVPTLGSTGGTVLVNPGQAQGLVRWNRIDRDSEAQHPVRRSIPSGDTDPGTSHLQAGEGSEPLNGRMVPLDPPGIWYLHAFKGAYTLLARTSAMDESIEGILDVVDRDDSGPVTQPDDNGVLHQTYRYLPIPHLLPGWHILHLWSTKELDAGVP
ncbi:hypothetical protein DFH07DRAFT_781266 [Mycena maculata]|uniref:Uncharacterized protein n=1 Tax=Mycena maculata TaxID=230809 RepID=A0AAD7MTM2_9AGAR|nr:hypothetical protein DFH07DRAFT_781266 [Mycena maculata]